MNCSCCHKAVCECHSVQCGACRFCASHCMETPACETWWRAQTDQERKPPRPAGEPEMKEADTP